MQKTQISMCVSTSDASFRRPMTRVHEWDEIDHAIDIVFKCGGSLNLAAEVEVADNPGAFVEKDNLSILSLPGRYVLTVFPARNGDKSSRRRYLWQANCALPIEVEIVEDIEFDTRFFSCDINLAKEICFEFFMARKITDKIIELTVDELVPLGY